MKIGLLTLQGGINYGAVLQAVALSDCLKGMGHQVEIIDYFTPEVYSFCNYHIFSKPVSLRSIIRKTLHRRRNKCEYLAFEAFRNKSLTFSRRCANSREFSEVVACYDAVICGSDQVWNPKANGGHLDEYFLFPVNSSKIKKIAFAASLGSVDMVRGLEPQIQKYLADYTALSVREEEAATYLRSFVDGAVERIIDPSLLMDAGYYARHEISITTPPRYILTYMLNGNENMVEAARLARAKSGLPVISLGKKIPGSRLVKDIGPGEFLHLVHCAQAVITNSFHGTAFALTYRRPFLVFGNGCYNSRMETLLAIAYEQKRFCNCRVGTDKLQLLEEAPSSTFSRRIEEERNMARSFLFRALNDAKGGSDKGLRG